MRGAVGVDTQSIPMHLHARACLASASLLPGRFSAAECERRTRDVGGVCHLARRLCGV